MMKSRVFLALFISSLSLPLYAETKQEISLEGQNMNPEFLARKAILLYEKNDLKTLKEFLENLDRDPRSEAETRLTDTIELIQNIASQRQYGYSVFEQFLPEKSLKIWGNVEKQWEGVSTLADMIRKEKGLPPENKFVDINQITDPELKAIIEARQRRHTEKKEK